MDISSRGISIYGEVVQKPQLRVGAYILHTLACIHIQYAVDIPDYLLQRPRIYACEYIFKKSKCVIYVMIYSKHTVLSIQRHPRI